MSIPLTVIYIIVIQCMIVADGAVEPGSSLRTILALSSRQQQFWKSQSSNFNVGFHPVGKGGLYVLGISIADTADESLVWTAGKNGGIRVGHKASFDFLTEGNLVLSNGRNTPMWQTKAHLYQFCTCSSRLPDASDQGFWFAPFQVLLKAGRSEFCDAHQKSTRHRMHAGYRSLSQSLETNKREQQ